MDILTVALIALVGTLNIVCFFVGAKVGQTVAKGKDIETPTINPADIIQEKKAKKASEDEMKKIDAILRNIDAYDGTGLGQEDIPRG